MTCAAASPGTGAPADDVGALVRCCAEATLAHIDASVDELGQAGTLLGDAMAVLRERFAAALAADTDAADPGECRRHLEAAMVALQCEDALVQMLDSMRRRSLRAADALRCAVTPGPSGPGPAAGPGDGRAAREATASRLRQAASVLNAGAARAGPVRQKKAVVGTVELF
ncbi:MAG: hypothetical protein EOP73_22135 [Variovorax sp.]|nr:MAG: hypothetical protein EOP73_22135 [Variovorax sp.]